jgi:ABC-2 type transport system ATP-binding protein
MDEDHVVRRFRSEESRRAGGPVEEHRPRPDERYEGLLLPHFGSSGQRSQIFRPEGHERPIGGCRFEAAWTGNDAVEGQAVGTTVRSRRQHQLDDRGSSDAAFPTIHLRELTVRLGDTTVLDSLDGTFGPGSRVAIRGPNGAGKTTLLRCICGTLVPHSGEVRIGNAVADSLRARGQVGAVIGPERAFALRLSGRENLRFAARLRLTEVAEAEDAVDKIVEELKLAGFVDRQTSLCSTGMLQQVGFARVLLGDPPVLVLDEPTRSMDEASTGRLWTALERRPDTTVFLTSHDEADLERCDEHVELERS